MPDRVVGPDGYFGLSGWARRLICGSTYFLGRGKNPESREFTSKHPREDLDGLEAALLLAARQPGASH